MKASDFTRILTAYSAILRGAGDADGAGELDGMAAALAGTPTATVATLVKKWTPGVVAARPASEFTLGTAAGRLAPLRTLLAEGGKPAALADLDALLGLFAQNPRAGLDALVAAPKRAPPKPRKPPAAKAPLREAVVAGFAARLQAALGADSAFAQVLEELQADASVTLPEFKEIARRLTGTAARSKADALKKISTAHQAQLSHRARAAATGGRTAA